MFKVLTEGCEPTRGSKYSACVDLYAREDVVIGAGETKLVGLGVCIDLSNIRENLVVEIKDEHDELLGSPVETTYDYQGYEEFLSSHYLQLMLRSSLSKHLIIANGVGVIDLDYEDEIKIRLHNPLNENVIIRYINQLLDKLGFNEAYCNKIGSADQYINKGDKIAQITLLEHKGYLFLIESDEKRSGGFGSTGI